MREPLNRAHVENRIVDIRVATVEDCGLVAALHARSWQQAYRGILSDHYLDFEVEQERLALWQDRFKSPKPNQIVLCAYSNEVILGFVCAFFRDDDQFGTFIDNLHVSLDARRSGCGSALVRHVRNISESRHSEQRIFLWVLANNDPAIKFYESIGGKRVEEAYWTPPDGGNYLKYRYVW
jgi:ribosomal protein S18 acetylase RimI-like enzyme